MSQLQERYLPVSSNSDGYYNNYNNDDLSGYDSRNYDGGYGGGYNNVQGYGYGRQHQRPIVIIHPPAAGAQQDPLLQGLSSLLPLAYLLPLALLATAANPTTTVVGRKKRHVSTQQGEVFFAGNYFLRSPSKSMESQKFRVTSIRFCQRPGLFTNSQKMALPILECYKIFVYQK